MPPRFGVRTLGVHAGRHRHSDGEDQGEEKEGQGRRIMVSSRSVRTE